MRRQNRFLKHQTNWATKKKKKKHAVNLHKILQSLFHSLNYSPCYPLPSNLGWVDAPPTKFDLAMCSEATCITTELKSTFIRKFFVVIPLGNSPLKHDMTRNSRQWFNKTALESSLTITKTIFYVPLPHKRSASSGSPSASSTSFSSSSSGASGSTPYKIPLFMWGHMQIQRTYLWIFLILFANQMQL